MTSDLEQWATRWMVPADAIAELRAVFGHEPGEFVPLNLDPTAKWGSEARQQDLVSLEAARKGIRLFRNNSGAFKDDSGRVIRFGLGNVSKQWNAVFASPDLVGWRRMLIEPHHVGTVIGRAVLREVKYEGWTFSPTDAHEAAQWNFLKLAIADGCDAAFATAPGTL